MANDWIKMRCDLDEDNHVLGLVAQTGLDVDSVLGKLYRLWKWVNRHASRDARYRPHALMKHLEASAIDSYLRHTGFAAALQAVGWLDTCDGRLRFPNFYEHNWFSLQTEKQRADAARRTARWKSKKGDAPLTGGDATADAPLTGGRRAADDTSPHLTQEKKDPPYPPQGGGGQADTEDKPRRRLEQCDNPVLAAAAKKVVAHYMKVVSPAHPYGGGVEAVMTLLDAGRTEAQLRAAAEGYARHCKQEETPRGKRQAPKNFFTSEGYYSGFLEEMPEAESPRPKPTPPPRVTPAQDCVRLQDYLSPQGDKP